MTKFKPKQKKITHGKTLGLRLPEWLRAAIDKDADDAKLPASEIVRQILEQFYSGALKPVEPEQTELSSVQAKPEQVVGPVESIETTEQNV